jgi:hypothetical protein
METWTLTLDKPDRYGREQTRTVNLIIDIRDFRDRAGLAWLVMAANPHLSVSDIQEVLFNVGEQHERPRGWISRRRWLFHGSQRPGTRRNADGHDEKARRIMEENPHLSSRQMAHLLRKNGIPRSPEWVRKNRVAAN